MTLRTRYAALALAVLGLAACDGGGSGGGGGGGATGLATLGQAFVAAFNADPNSTPVDAQSVGLVLTPSVTPFNP